MKDKIKTFSSSFANVAKFKYSGMTLTNQSCIHEEIKGTLNSEMPATNQSRHCCLYISYNILPVTLHGRQTWSFNINKRLQTNVFENRQLENMVWPKREEGFGVWEKMCNVQLHCLYS